MGAESLIGMGIGLIGAIGGLFGNKKANKQLAALQAQDPNYATSTAGIANKQLADSRLGLAQSLLNAKMPGSSTIEHGIYGNAANQQGVIERNATSGAQALALGAANVGDANNAFRQEGLDQNNYYQQNLNNLNQAQEGVMNENNADYNDQLRQYGDKVQIQGAINKNRQNTWGSIANLGFGTADFAANGGFDGIGGAFKFVEAVVNFATSEFIAIDTEGESTPCEIICFALSLRVANLFIIYGSSSVPVRYFLGSK